MADEEHWTERRRRVVRCKIHGLHYDPKMTSGCSMCRKEGLKAQPRRSPPQLVVILLSLLGIAAIAYHVLRSATGEEEGSSAAEIPLRASSQSSRLLDPNAYRGPLVALERALFETPAGDLPAIGDDLVIAAAELSAAIRRTDPSAGREAADAIAELGRAIEPRRFTLDELEITRRSWQRLRRRHFETAGWVSHADAASRTDRAAFTAYQSVADELVTLVDEGAQRARSLAADSVSGFADVDARAAVRRAEQWQQFAAVWSQRLEILAGRLPARPSSEAEGRILVATQKLERAFAGARALAAERDLPGHSDLSTRLEDAYAQAAAARQAFDDLLLY